MLSYILIFVLGVSPALQAAFDLPLQLAFQRAVLAACLAWMFLRAYRDGLPRAFLGKKFYPLWAAAALSLAALLASPFRGQVFNEWGNYAAGLMIFFFSSFINKEDRGRVERGVLWGAWLIFSLSLIQAFALGNFLLHTPLTNLNALALYAVMIIPAALERKSWPLAAAMLVLVIWTQSLGAALAGLTAAGFYAASRPGAGRLRGNAFLLGALAVLGAAVVYLLQADSVAGRLVWWRSAWDMFSARPLSGFGHAAFTWAQAAFQPDGAFREYSIYAHNYYLEFLSENGLPAAIAWFWVVLAAVRRKKGLVKYSLIAALTHSFVDFGLSVPANFWLFCWLLSSPDEEGGALPRPSRRALGTALAAVLMLAAALLNLDYRSLAFEKARVRAEAGAAAGDLQGAEADLAPALRSGLFRAPALEQLGRLAASDRNGPPGFRSAVYYEMALRENRYSPAAWKSLGTIYSQPGLEAQAADLLQRRREVFE